MTALLALKIIIGLFAWFVCGLAGVYIIGRIERDPDGSTFDDQVPVLVFLMGPIASIVILAVESFLFIIRKLHPVLDAVRSMGRGEE